MTTIVRFVLPDGLHVIHATTSEPDEWGSERIAEALRGVSISVPQGARRAHPPRDSYCDACTRIYAARYPLASYRLPSEGPS
ncbi:hypothetical protein ACL03H_02735 [Saccharopolyspora sp. MS10]|uniref:hypothetical protein n=1 Tax=Saccharopolyspora sp. MS10 TaxID=3385973 RepID=UPI0039A118EE